jgi:hypothetical protein
MTLKELTKECKKVGIKGYSTCKTKSDVLKLLTGRLNEVNRKRRKNVKIDANKQAKYSPKKETMTLQTEVLGKQFEMAICLTYDTPYDGKYKYDLDFPKSLIPRLEKLKEYFPHCTHTASKGARYDFTGKEDTTIHLSAKTTKKAGMVAPQVIGQPQPAKFCEVIGIPYTNRNDLKKHIQENIKTILPVIMDYTFNCPNLYYNKFKNTIRYIELILPIPWNDFTYKWTKNYDEWNNSSLLKIVKPDGKEVTILEVQFHETNRTNMVCRWAYEEFINMFYSHLSIKDL